MLKLTYLIAFALIATLPLATLIHASDDESDSDDNTTLEVYNQSDETASEEAVSIKQKIRDATITASIKTAMMLDAEVDALDIDIDTVNQVVTLNGTVDSLEEKMGAEDIVLDTAGVVSVVNQLRIAVRTKS